MKTYLVRNTQSTYGYQLKIVDDEGNMTFLDPIGRDPHNEKVLHLPANPSNRQWITPKGLDEQELQYKESRHFGPKKESENPQTSRGWIEYLTEDEKKILEGLRRKAIARKQADTIKAKIAALQALLEEEGE